jgi:hypothetical protein
MFWTTVKREACVVAKLAFCHTELVEVRQNAVD